MNIFGSFKSFLASIFSHSEVLLVDIGSTSTKIFLGEKQLFNQATCIAVHKSTQEVVAFGDKALHLLGKTPQSIEISFPILSGSVANTQYLELFLTAVLQDILPKLQLQRYVFGVTGKVAIMSSISPAKKTVLAQILKNVGFTKVEFVSSGYAVAKSITDADSKLKDVCILDIGAQKAEISIFSLGELIYSQSYKWGGIYLTESIQRIIRSKHHCTVGWHVAETAKKEIGTVVATKEKLAIRGKDLVTQASKTAIIDASDVRNEFAKSFDELLDHIEQFISLLPSEIAISVLEKGIYLTGGTSQIRGIDEALIQRFKCDVLVSSHPELDVIIGLQKI